NPDGAARDTDLSQRLPNIRRIASDGISAGELYDGSKSPLRDRNLNHWSICRCGRSLDRNRRAGRPPALPVWAILASPPGYSCSNRIDKRQRMKNIAVVTKNFISPGVERKRCRRREERSWIPSPVSPRGRRGCTSSAARPRARLPTG